VVEATERREQNLQQEKGEGGLIRDEPVGLAATGRLCAFRLYWNCKSGTAKSGKGVTYRGYGGKHKRKRNFPRISTYQVLVAVTAKNFPVLSHLFQTENRGNKSPYKLVNPASNKARKQYS
jgi:hypothetical protein